MKAKIPIVAFIAGSLLCFPVRGFSQSEAGYGYLYNYNVDMQTEMEWNVAPEALEVGVARGFAAGLLNPLGELGDLGAVQPYTEESLSTELESVVAKRKASDEAARDTVLYDPVLYGTTSRQYTNVVNFLEEMSRSSLGGESDWFLPGRVIEEGAESWYSKTYKFTLPISKIQMELPPSLGGMDELGPRSPWADVEIDFTQGWKKKAYDYIAMAFAFVHVMSAAGYAIAMIRWVFI